MSHVAQQILDEKLEFIEKWRASNFDQKLQFLNKFLNKHNYKFFLLNEKDKNQFHLDNTHKVFSVQQSMINDENCILFYLTISQIKDNSLDNNLENEQIKE